MRDDGAAVGQCDGGNLQVIRTDRSAGCFQMVTAGTSHHLDGLRQLSLRMPDECLVVDRAIRSVEVAGRPAALFRCLARSRHWLDDDQHLIVGLRPAQRNPQGQRAAGLGLCYDTNGMHERSPRGGIDQDRRRASYRQVSHDSRVRSTTCSFILLFYS